MSLASTNGFPKSWLACGMGNQHFWYWLSPFLPKDYFRSKTNIDDNGRLQKGLTEWTFTTR
jgi:hypothetical protein